MRTADPAAVKQEEKRLTGRDKALPGVGGNGGTESSSSVDGMSQHVGRIRSALAIDVSLALPDVLQKANAMMGFEAEGSLPEQTRRLIEALGLQ